MIVMNVNAEPFARMPLEDHQEHRGGDAFAAINSILINHQLLQKVVQNVDKHKHWCPWFQ